MIRVTAHSRLHFGLLSPAADTSWANIDSEPTMPSRRFGGVGLMIEDPNLVLSIEPAKHWTATGPMSERALNFANGFGAQISELSPHTIIVEEAPPAHSGLGSGTQLGLTVAKALAVAAGNLDWTSVELARRVGRGLRSAVGVHGFERGGLIVEAGKRGDEAVAPLIISASLPEAWRIVVVLPEHRPVMFGAPELAAFEGLAANPDAAESLCRLVLLGMLPALREVDCRAFGEAVYDFNARVGELFASVQRGRYAGMRCSEIVSFLRGIGISGVGQSSWGPALFAIVEDSDRAASIANQLRERFGSATAWVTRPAGPAEVTTG
jgi:beta-RFAP synthase